MAKVSPFLWFYERIMTNQALGIATWTDRTDRTDTSLFQKISFADLMSESVSKDVFCMRFTWQAIAVWDWEVMWRSLHWSASQHLKLGGVWKALSLTCNRTKTGTIHPKETTYTCTVIKKKFFILVLIKTTVL